MSIATSKATNGLPDCRALALSLSDMGKRRGSAGDLQRTEASVVSLTLCGQEEVIMHLHFECTPADGPVLPLESPDSESSLPEPAQWMGPVRNGK